MHGFHIPTTVRHALLLEMSVLKKYIKKNIPFNPNFTYFFKFKMVLEKKRLWRRRRK